MSDEEKKALGEVLDKIQTSESHWAEKRNNGKK